MKYQLHVHHHQQLLFFQQRMLYMYYLKHGNPHRSHRMYHHHLHHHQQLLLFQERMLYMYYLKHGNSQHRLYNQIMSILQVCAMRRARGPTCYRLMQPRRPPRWRTRCPSTRWRWSRSHLRLCSPPRWWTRCPSTRWRWSTCASPPRTSPGS